MINQPLEGMIASLRLETGRSDTPNLGISERPALIRILNRIYQQYWREYNWPTLKVRRDIILQAGQQFYDFPSDIDPDRVLSLRTNYDGTWSVPIMRGISMDEYNIQNSDLGATQDPVRRWDMLNTGDGVQIEAWPIPATSTDTLMRVEGILKFQKMVAAPDICKLDDDMIILACAGEMLARTSKQDAKIKLQASSDIFEALKGGLDHTSPNKINMNGAHNRLRRDTPGCRIIVAKSQY